MPPSSVRLVYLDLNQWIMLSKAMAEHRDGERHRGALEACLGAATAGSAVFPLSDSTYGEVAKIGSRRQRRDLREVMEELSGFYVVMSRPDIAAHEVERLLDDELGPSPSPVNRMAYLDRGVARAFGLVGGFKVYDGKGTDVTDDARDSFPGGPDAFDAAFAEAQLQLERGVLEGPSSLEEEAQLRANGWRPGGSVGVDERRLEQETAQVLVFDSNQYLRRQRLRSVITLRELVIEMNGALSRGLADRGAVLDDLGSTVEERQEMFDSLPSLDVAVTIKASYHRNPNHPWKVNDIYDIDAMGSTVPYCDYVVTDRAVVSHVTRSHLDERLGTKVLATLDELVEEL